MTEVWRWWRHEDSEAAVYHSWTDWGLRLSYTPHRHEVDWHLQVGPFELIYWRRRKAYRLLPRPVE